MPTWAVSRFAYRTAALAIVWDQINVNVFRAIRRGQIVPFVRATVTCELKFQFYFKVSLHCFSGHLFRRCENGFCANRTGCICQSGYRYDVNTTSCLPDCGDTCENGICIEPGFCRCFNGYQRNGLKCEAICEQ